MEEKIKELEKQLKELKKEIAKQDKKEPKSLSDYKVYEPLKKGEIYKYINGLNIRDLHMYANADSDKSYLYSGNVYLPNTPEKLLKRECKKRQLWFGLEKHLKENNCLASSEDFKIGNATEKFSCYYSFLNGTFIINSSYDCKANTIHSTEIIELENYMNTLSEEDIKIMFDVEE